METRGVIMFNRGTKCVIRAITCLYSLRKHWSGPVTFYLEQPMPKEFVEVCKYFNVDVVLNDENPNMKVLVRKTDMFGNPPYDRTLWIDSDMIVVGKLDEMFDYLDNADVAIPNFAGWVSNGGTISKRIKRFQGIAEQKYLDKSLENHPAVNTGILSFKKSDKWKKFVEYWVDLAHRGSQKHIFISDEVSFQILYPSLADWDLKCMITGTKFNVSVLHDHDKSTDRRVIHYHGQKHVLNHKNCDIWKDTFKEMCDGNIANINAFLQYADKRLKRYMDAKKLGLDNLDLDTTIVTACDPNYVEILKHTYPNWVKYKKVTEFPMIVFVNGMDVNTDERLEFLRKDKNVQLIPWSMPELKSHREEMLSAFVFGAAEHVKTGYWLKIDADSYATDNRPFITDAMKNFVFCGHKWGYSRPEHIKQLDEWAKKHWKRRLRKAKPMIGEGRIEGNRFYHNKRRTISFIQLHSTKFTNLCVKLLKEKRLPAPTQDTYMFYVASRFAPDKIGTMNFKKQCGFTQGRGKSGAEHIRQKVAEVENSPMPPVAEIKNQEVLEAVDQEDMVDIIDQDDMDD